MTQEERRFNKIAKNLSKEDKEYLERWYDGYLMFHELRDPIEESPEVKIGEDIYWCRREAFFSTYECEINYGYSVYKWDGTYTEKEWVPGGKKHKFKNWKEIFHSHGSEKIPPKEMIEHALKVMEIAKERENAKVID